MVRGSPSSQSALERHRSPEASSGESAPESRDASITAASIVVGSPPSEETMASPSCAVGPEQARQASPTNGARRSRCRIMGPTVASRCAAFTRSRPHQRALTTCAPCARRSLEASTHPAPGPHGRERNGRACLAYDGFRLRSGVQDGAVEQRIALTSQVGSGVVLARCGPSFRPGLGCRAPDVPARPHEHRGLAHVSRARSALRCTPGRAHARAERRPMRAAPLRRRSAGASAQRHPRRDRARYGARPRRILADLRERRIPSACAPRDRRQ